MKRREFITTIAAAAAWPLAARAQQPMPVVGYLSSGSAGAFTSRLSAFRQGLADVGFHEGQNLAIEYRWADGQDQRLPAMAADLVQRRVSVIAAPGGLAAARAAKAATATIPVVFETGANPVQAGLVASLSRPEGNITGVTSLNLEVGPKRLELLHELVPAAKAIGVLVNPANSNSVAAAKELEPIAPKLGLQLHALPASKRHRFGNGLCDPGRTQGRRARRHPGSVLHQPQRTDRCADDSGTRCLRPSIPASSSPWGD